MLLAKYRETIKWYILPTAALSSQKAMVSIWHTSTICTNPYSTPTSPTNPKMSTDDFPSITKSLTKIYYFAILLFATLCQYFRPTNGFGRQFVRTFEEYWVNNESKNYATTFNAMDKILKMVLNDIIIYIIVFLTVRCWY